MGVFLTNDVVLFPTCLPVQIWSNKYVCLSVYIIVYIFLIMLCNIYGSNITL